MRNKPATRFSAFWLPVAGFNPPAAMAWDIHAQLSANLQVVNGQVPGARGRLQLTRFWNTIFHCSVSVLNTHYTSRITHHALRITKPMPFSFIFPAALWLLVILIPLCWLALATPRRLGPLRFWLSLLLRSAIVIALVLCLAGIQLRQPVDQLATVFLLDRSESVVPASAARAEQFVRDALLSMPPDDRAGVVLFGGDALVERAANGERDLPAFGAVPTAARTNIAQAVALGLSLLPNDANKRMVLLSDGGANDGDTNRAVQQAKARGVEISYLDLGAGGNPNEALVTGMRAPASVRTGQSVTINIAVESSVAQPVHLGVREGDQIIAEQDVQLQAGTTNIPVTVQAHNPGFQRYRAEITPQSDTQPKNNAAEALVQVEGPPRVLLVEGAPGEAQPLHDALAAAQVTAETIAPAALPTDLSALAAYEAVALVNVPASALPAGAAERLPQYVRDLGRGLVVIGGDKAYGVGGYGDTPLAAALPVDTNVRDRIEKPSLAIVFILDKSRSMQNCHCNGPNRKTDTDRSYFKTGRAKLDIGKDAVIQSVGNLSPQDTVAIVTFDGSANVAMGLQQNVTREAVQQVLAPIPPDGIDTNIGSGLRKAQETLRASGAAIKHAVLLTDGWGEGEDPLQVAAAMRAEGMTLSVIADGKGSAPALQDMANAGGGRYLAAEGPEDIPGLFVGETNHVAGNYIVEGQFTPRYGAATPVLNGLESGLPPLYGYDATTARQTATVALYGKDNSPVLAQWQYGLGRVVAWTSDTSGRWAKDWLAWPEFPRFAAQTFGWVLPTVTDAGMRATVTTQGSTLTIAAELGDTTQRDGLTATALLIGTDGSRKEIALQRSQAGGFTADTPLPAQGGYIVQVVGTENGQVVTQSTAGLVVPYAAEYGLKQHDPALLASLAQATGGQALARPADAFAHTLSGAYHATDLWRAMLLVALLLLPLDVLMRQLFAPRQRHTR